MTLNPPEWLTHSAVDRINTAVAHKRNALRRQILSGDYDSIKACLNDFGDDVASVFVREILSQIGGADEPNDLEIARRYWAMRKVCDRWLAGYLETAVTFDDVETEMKRDGLI